MNNHSGQQPVTTPEGAEEYATLCHTCGETLGSNESCDLPECPRRAAPPKPAPDVDPLDVLNSLRQWQHDPRVELRARKLVGDAADVIETLRRPAPDAMRSAAEPFAKLGGGWDVNEPSAYYDLPDDTVIYHNSGACITAGDVRKLRAAFHSAPPPSPDGVQTALLAARDYIADDNNPKSNRVLESIRSALSTSPTVAAAEPVAWGRVIDGKAVTVSLEWTPANDEPLYANPPVRGEREAFARATRVQAEKVYDDIEDNTAWEAMHKVYFDAILSLPVQPGAGEQNG